MTDVLESITVVNLREIARTLGVHPIPRRKKDIIERIRSSNNVEKLQDLVKEHKNGIRCSGAGVTKAKLLKQLREEGLLGGYRNRGGGLQLSELKKICRESKPNKDLPIPLQEEEILADEHAALIKERDPDLYSSSKEIIPFIPNPRDLLYDDGPDESVLRFLSDPKGAIEVERGKSCLLYTSPSPRDRS